MLVRKISVLFASVLLVAAVQGCKDDHSHGPKSPPASQPADGGSAHPNAVKIGETTKNGLTFAAKQDEKVTAGGEGAFDLAISGFADGQKPKAVRFWVGTEDAKGSVKARATEETAGNWHTHVEIPKPLDPGAKFWAEVEPATGEKFTVSFDPLLK